MKSFLFVYIIMMFVFCITIVKVSYRDKHHLNGLKEYVSKTTMSDMALATEFVDIRFYSLGSMVRVYDDPVLGEKSFLGFVYRKKDE